jgi:hypothetical protein
MPGAPSPVSRRIVIWDDGSECRIEVDHDAFVAFAVSINRGLWELESLHVPAGRRRAASPADCHTAHPKSSSRIRS